MVVIAASRRSRQRPSPLRSGRGGGLCPFVVVTAEVFFTPTQKQRKNRFKYDFRLFITGTCLGFAPLRGTCAARRFFRRNHRKKEEKTRKKATSTGRGRWSCGGLRRAALEVTAVFCGHGRWFFLEVFLGFSIWRLKRHNLQLASVADRPPPPAGGTTTAPGRGWCTPLTRVALCASCSHRTTRKSWPAFLTS